MLEISDLSVSYGAISALSGISLKVAQGSIVTLIGSNGAGKTTTLRTISGLLRARGGTVKFLGEDITELAPHKIVARGIGHVPEGRMIFSNLTVDENLAMGAYLQRDKAAFTRDREYVFGIFPRLKERLRQTAGTLSGGEQQMLAVARAIIQRPRVLLIDDEMVRTLAIVAEPDQLPAALEERYGQLLDRVVLSMAHEAHIRALAPVLDKYGRAAEGC